MAIRCKPAKWQKAMLDSLPEFITPQELSLLMRIGLSTVQQHCAEGKLPAQKICGSWRISKAKLLERFDMS